MNLTGKQKAREQAIQCSFNHLRWHWNGRLWWHLWGLLVVPLLGQAQTLVHSTPLAGQPTAGEHFLAAWATGRTQQPEALVVCFVTPDTKRSQSTLTARAFDPQTGALRWSKTLDSIRVGKWLPAPNKGSVAQSFNNAVAATAPSEAIPLAYQFSVSVSPNAQRVLSYAYDYSRPHLFVRASLFNSEGQLLHHEEIPIDNQAVQYALQVSDDGRIYLLNSQADGGIQLIEHQPATGAQALMEVSGSSAPRHQLQLQLVGGEAWVVSTVPGGRGLSGVVLTRFDLHSHSTAQVQYVPLPESLKDLPLNSLPGFRVNARREVSLALGSQIIASSGYAYRPQALNDLAAWQPRKAVVALDEVAVLAYDTLGISVDEQILKREEKVSNTEFLRRVSYVVRPVPGLPEVLIEEKLFIRLEKAKESLYLRTYQR